MRLLPFSQAPATGETAVNAKAEDRGESTGIALPFIKKKPKQTRSLFGEIMDWMLLPLLLIWPLSVLITYLVAQNLATKPFDQALEDNVRAVAAQVKVTPQGKVQFVFPAPASDVLQSDEKDKKFYQVLGVSGEVLSGDRDLNAAPADEAVLVDEVRLRDDNVKGQSLRVAYTWVQPERGGAPLEGSPVLVQVAETLGKRERLARDITSGIVFPQFVTLPISVLLVYLGLTRGLRSLSRLADRLRAREPNDMSPIAEKDAPLELQPLLVSMNELMAKLDSNLATQKRFIADAAHQMKTPLAGLRTQAELALRQTDPAELRASLRQVARSSERATHVVNQLLSLARTEHRGAAAFAPQQTLQLAKIAADVTRELVPLALERGLDLGFEASEQAQRLTLKGDALLLKELMQNLVDNAIAYTPRGGSITVYIKEYIANATDLLPGSNISSKQYKALLLEVEDTGPGISPEERELIFQPFYRTLDASGDNQRGSGLGLAIVKEVAQQHGAQIRVSYNTKLSNPEFPGCVISVIFPLG
jgi:two-component system, OmpR family, sensor histidine kinase TctE